MFKKKIFHYHLLTPENIITISTKGDTLLTRPFKGPTCIPPLSPLHLLLPWAAPLQWCLQTTLTLEFINSEMLTQVTGQNEAFAGETRKDFRLPDHFPCLFWIMLPYKQDEMHARPNIENIVGNSLAISRGVSKHIIIRGKMVLLLLVTCATLTHYDRGRCRVGAAWEMVFRRRTHHSRFLHSSTTKKEQGARLLLLSWSFPVFSIAYHKHPHLFYGVVLTAFLGGESSHTVRSWALCGLRLPLSLKNSEHVGNGSVIIFRTLQFQFSLTLYWDRQCAHLCVAACSCFSFSYAPFWSNPPGSQTLESSWWNFAASTFAFPF